MRLQSRTFYLYALFVVVYAAIILLPFPDKVTLAKYRLHPLQLRLLYLTLLIPIAGMWYAIFYGYSTLNKYSQLIRSNRDGKQLIRLAQGLFVLAIGVPLGSIASGIFGLIARGYPSFTAAATIIPNYINVMFPLIAFYCIYIGSRTLNTPSRNRPGMAFGNVTILIVTIIAVTFCDLIAREHRSVMIYFHMSYSWVMLTIAIPYIYTWFIGLIAIAEMYEYSKHLAGVLYRKGWVRLSFGLGFIIAVDILLQFLGTLSSWFNNLALADLLLLLYVLLFLLAGGFIVVALGTRQLMKIEEA
jgi:hypothetical protein